MWVGASSLLLAACSDHPMAPRPVPLPVCAAGRGFQVALAVDSFVSVDPIRDSGCIIFPANASAKVVRGHMALYVDNLAPANGLNQADLDTLTDLFNSRIYPLDTAAFGNVSDIDNNTVVIVLMTNVVNQLTPKNVCGGGYIAGFFLGADLDPRFARDNRVNHGEIFYSIVADSAGVLSCIHSRTAAKQDVPITFTHEFQHMISFAEHVLF